MKKSFNLLIALIFFYGGVIFLHPKHPLFNISLFNLYGEDISSQWEVIVDGKLQQDFIVEQDKNGNYKDKIIDNQYEDMGDNKLATDKTDTKPAHSNDDNKDKPEKLNNTLDNDTDDVNNNDSTVKDDDKKQSAGSGTDSVKEEQRPVLEEFIEKPDLPEKKQLGLVTEEILSRPDVDKFRQMYLTPKWIKLLNSYLESGMEYRLYVRQQIKELNIPEFIEYLPIVESNYKPTAKSYSGALGMWQFMENSVFPFLILNDFVDQRLDPWYSTDAGLSKLIDNYNYFGDWFIAIAAYNCGGGTMTKALRAAGVKDYWYLVDNEYLPKQTAEYIPKLLAIADIAINSEYYGVDLPKHDREFEILENEKNAVFDYITVNKAYSLSELAREIKVSEKIMKHLNLSYIKGITHPAKESAIRLPLGTKEAAEKAISHMTPIEYPFKYKVVAGDSLWSISRKYNVTVQQICDLNNIEEDEILRIGKVLYIPSK